MDLVPKYPGEPPNWVFSMFSFIGFVVVTIPFPWHLEAWNTGTCLYMAWTSLSCLSLFINSIVFNKTVINMVPVWCDISSRLLVGASVGIPAASLCINRRLYKIAAVQSVTNSKAEKRRTVMIDLAIGLGIPFLQMILQVIVQGHRFNIYEEIGCYPMTYNTPPAYPLVFCWPVVISIMSALYCLSTIRILVKRRADFNQLLAGNNNLNSSRYLRLISLAGFELILGIPLSVYLSLYLNLHQPGTNQSPINPWISWANVHYHFSYVGQFPSIEWKQDPITVTAIEMTRWSMILCAFIFFGFFGFAQEARKHYRIAFHSVAKRVGYTTIGFTSGLSSSFGGSRQPMSSTIGRGTLPVYVRQETTSKRDSGASFSTNLTLGDVGGTLDDVKEPYSPTGSTSRSSTYSINEKRDEDTSPPHPPALPRPDTVFNVASPPRNSGDVSKGTRPDSNII